MTNEKLLTLVNKAIENLRDNEPYGRTPVDFMRENAIKSTDNMSIFLDSVGAYLEEIRCGVLADIELDAAKKAGKSSVLSTVKKLSKSAYNNNIESREYFAYAHYDEADNKYWLTNNYWLVISETSDGMTLCPERIKPSSPFNYKRVIPQNYEMQEIELPPIGKLSAYMKSAKAKMSKAAKKAGMHNKVILSNGTAMNGEYLELGMKLTGATAIKYKNNMTAHVMEGNGYTFVVSPVQNKENLPPTDFDNI